MATIITAHISNLGATSAVVHGCTCTMNCIALAIERSDIPADMGRSSTTRYIHAAAVMTPRPVRITQRSRRSRGLGETAATEARVDCKLVSGSDRPGSSEER